MALRVCDIKNMKKNELVDMLLKTIDDADNDCAGNSTVTEELTLKDIKELFNCKTRMPGTVKCRPTVAY